MKKISILIACFVFASLNCSKDDNIPGGNSQLTEIKESFLGTALNLLQEVREDEANGENIIISPLSIEVALMMTLNGAEGKTYDEMKTALNLQNFTTEDINASYTDLAEALESIDEGEINISNAVFWDPNKLNLYSEFKDIMEAAYDAHLSSLDFSDQSTVDAINDWADESTNGRIQKILDQISEDEAMFLINALYMKADWENPFLEDVTQSRPFKLRNGSEIQVPTMWQDAAFSHFVGSEFSAVDLAFKDKLMTMTFIIPVQDQKVEDLLESFQKNPSDLIDLYDRDLKTERAIVQLPKFEITYHKELKDVLSSLGMSTAFSQNSAQFPNFGEAGGNIFLSRVIHDTFLKIDEKGAEGAAVTTVGVGVTSIPPVLEFNRPFMFLVRHIDTGAIVFAGIIHNPIQDN